MRELGRIVRLQIQRSSLKTGEKPRRSYDPAPLLAVDRVAVGPEGVLGVAHPGRRSPGWALGGTVEADVLKEQLQFLDGGTRGYYCRGVGAGVVALGELVVVL